MVIFRIGFDFCSFLYRIFVRSHVLEWFFTFFDRFLWIWEKFGEGLGGVFLTIYRAYIENSDFVKTLKNIDRSDKIQGSHYKFSIIGLKCKS